ncbi:apolipoprotein D-like [Oncorhynchus tshawytscha]|uniref:apolipoprotein D-like n=1 Tax=Oncorhynchus tshawytscha TaxID=74940 RepID=UPI000D0A417D|nr:apolipoprotein D-like [Oncorhynchus tshawytscha]
MQALQVLSLTLLSVLAANAQTFRPGKCPQPPVQANFDTARYLGKWYEIQKLPAIFQKGECSTATYSLKSPGVVGVLNRELLYLVDPPASVASLMRDEEPAQLVDPPASVVALVRDVVPDHPADPAMDPG